MVEEARIFFASPRIPTVTKYLLVGVTNTNQAHDILARACRARLPGFSAGQSLVSHLIELEAEAVGLTHVLDAASKEPGATAHTILALVETEARNLKRGAAAAEGEGEVTSSKATKTLHTDIFEAALSSKQHRVFMASFAACDCSTAQGRIDAFA